MLIFKWDLLTAIACPKKETNPLLDSSRHLLQLTTAACYFCSNRLCIPVLYGIQLHCFYSLHMKLRVVLCQYISAEAISFGLSAHLYTLEGEFSKRVGRMEWSWQLQAWGQNGGKWIAVGEGSVFPTSEPPIHSGVPFQGTSLIWRVLNLKLNLNLAKETDKVDPTP